MKKIFLLVIAVFAFGCLNAQELPKGFKKSDNNIIYRVNKANAEGKQVQENDITIGKFSIKINDSIIQNTYSAPKDHPCFLVSQQTKVFKGDLMDAITMMREGEDYTFAFPVDSMRKMMNIPATINEGYVYYKVKVAQSITKEQFEQQEKARQDSIKAQNEILKVKEQETIANYLKTNNWSDKNIEGIYYKELKEGTGELAKAGDVVKVHYIGQLLDGTYFDTSVDTVAKANNLYNPQRKYEPLEFPIGAGKMIPGFEIAVRQMKQGGRAVVVLPSNLAYGDRDMGVIKPYSPLMFTLELVSIENKQTTTKTNK